LQQQDDSKAKYLKLKIKGKSNVASIFHSFPLCGSWGGRERQRDRERERQRERERERERE
jgi:hypothetical protein